MFITHLPIWPYVGTLGLFLLTPWYSITYFNKKNMFLDMFTFYI